jgi:hypothetical protein
MIVAMQLVERPRGVASYGAASVKAMPDLVRARFRVVRVEQTLQVASAAVHAVARRCAGTASAQDLAPGHVVVSAAVIIGFSITHD